MKCGLCGDTAGLGAGTTEAVAIVCPMEVVKIRLQAQSHSLADPLEVPRYRNAAHAVYTIVREEGLSTLYRGVSLTALRQATNQGKWTLGVSAFRRTKEQTEVTGSCRRCEFYDVPGVEEICAEAAAGAHRFTIMADYVNWVGIRSDGAVLKRADRHDKDT